MLSSIVLPSATRAVPVTSFRLAGGDHVRSDWLALLVCQPPVVVLDRIDTLALEVHHGDVSEGALVLSVHQLSLIHI
eukprot:6668963-Prorocentrum_lima.AAC.1